MPLGEVQYLLKELPGSQNIIKTREAITDDTCNKMIFFRVAVQASDVSTNRNVFDILAHTKERGSRFTKYLKGTMAFAESRQNQPLCPTQPHPNRPDIRYTLKLLAEPLKIQ